MTDDVFRELGLFFALCIAGPFIIGWPITVIWITVAIVVRRLTGWEGLLPANVWNEP